MSPPGQSIADQLIECLKSGTTLDLIPNVPTDALLPEERMHSWDERHDLDADIVRDLLLGRHAHHPDPRGLRLRGVRIRGRLDLDLIISTVPLAIHDSLLDEGLSADQARFPTLELWRCRIGSPTEIALDLDRLQIDGSLYLNKSQIIAATHHGSVRMIDARVGNLFSGGATFLNIAGPAMLAHGLRTERDLFLDLGFTAEGRGERGAIGMTDARIGRLHLSGAVLRNPTGPALDLDGIQATRDVHLDAGFIADGATENGALRISGARIGGRLILTSSTVRNESGPAVIAEGMNVENDLTLNTGAVIEGSGQQSAVTLAGTRVGGTVDLSRATIRNLSEPQHRWMIDGLRYSQVPRLVVGQATENRIAWLNLLRTGTPAYAAQPYQQLAAAFRAEGHDSDVRAILVAQRRDHLARGGLSFADRWWGRTTGVLLGYGYQPWRALLYLLAVLTVSVGLTVGLGTHGALALAATAARPGLPCAVIDMIGRGLDLGTPFLPKTTSTTCIATTTTLGTVLTVSLWILQLAAWSLAALFVAGFTGIVRKT